MTKESKHEAPEMQLAAENGSAVEVSGRPVETARSGRPTDRWSIRRAEIKKQKRRAHRRRINASNRPG